MIDRKEYMKTTYANYWINARNDLYGFMDYDRALINLISSQIRVRVTEKILFGGCNRYWRTNCKTGYFRL